MARLASQAKMGYYPTPPPVVEHLKKGISLSGEGTFRLLDTCCGEGEALSLLAAGLGPEIETFGVELDETRFKKSSQRLHHAVWGDALTEIRVSLKAFSLLWLNPPYDWSDGKRLEARFLEAHLKYLMPKGWLIFIIPHIALKSCMGSLSRLSNLQVYAFPKPEYDVFKQLVVVGQKSPTSKSDEQLVRLNEIAWLLPAEAWKTLPTTLVIPPGAIALPPAPAGRLAFASERSDMERTAELVAKSPLWRELEVAATPKTLQKIRPLAPLRLGHQSMLLAAGFMDGEVESKNRRLVIKGSVKKSFDSETEITETHRIFRQREKIQTTIRAIDLDKKEIFVISGKKEGKSAMPKMQWDVIHTYTRRQAIADGVLVDLMQPEFAELVHNAGIKHPVAMTAEVFTDYVELTPMARQMCNDIKGRLWDVLWMFRQTAKKCQGDTVFFDFYCVTDRREPSKCTLKAVIGPGDTLSPVITIMHPSQD